MQTTIQKLNENEPLGHDGGQTVDRVDQVSSVVLLGLAVVGAVLAVGLTHLVH